MPTISLTQFKAALNQALVAADFSHVVLMLNATGELRIACRDAAGRQYATLSGEFSTEAARAVLQRFIEIRARACAAAPLPA